MDNNNLYLCCCAENDDACLNGSTRGMEMYLCIKWVHSQGTHYCGDQMTSVGWIGTVYLTYYNDIFLTGLLLEPLICSSFMVANIFDVDCVHYNGVITSAMASQITSLTIVYPSVYSRRRSKENIKAPRHWSLWGEFTGDRWIPRTKGQLRQNVSISWRHHASDKFYTFCLFVVRINLISNTQFPIS